MTTNFRTRNNIRLNSKDLLLAAEIATNSDPCVGSLREVENEGKPGAKTSYCILGTVIQAAALRRHISFDTASAILGEESGTKDALVDALGSPETDTLGVSFLDSTNDDFVNADGRAIKGKLRKWQVRKLVRLHREIAAAEANRTSNRA